MQPLVVCGTTGGAYARSARLMALSARDWGLEATTDTWPDLGDWLANCGQKPAYLLGALERHPGRPLVWLDADMVVVERPALLWELAAGPADLAVHYLGTPGTPRDSRECLSTVIWLSGRPRCHAIVRVWSEMQRKHPRVLSDGRPAWDQRSLELTLRGCGSEAVAELPPEYCWFPQISTMHYGPRRAVLLHTRAAFRRLYEEPA